MRASVDEPCAVVRSKTVMSAVMTPCVRNTRCLFAFDIDRFMRARQAFVVQGVAPVSGEHVAAAILPKASTKPGVPSKAPSFASALLRFLMQVVALSRASSPEFSMTSRMASRTSGILAISILFALPQDRFIMAMQACKRALSDASGMVVVVPECAFMNGPPRATNARVFKSPHVPIRYRSLSSVAVKLRTVSTAYSLPSQSAFCSDTCSIVRCTNSRILRLDATATRRWDILA
mmetsp:Transcript_7909/g.16315  ORF Transcript_7909/g.16315 Transcript_7909/m.16315 type:complete len:234 (-) Transcript_7909:444-1145(-)